jgi:hypothetical protein
VILCLHCQKLSSPDSNNCQFCGATLPKLAYKAEMITVDNITILYDMLSALAEALANSKVKLEDFVEYLGLLFEKLEAQEKEIREMEFDDEIKEEFKEEMEIGLSGIEAIFEGLEIMGEYEEEEDPNCLADGLEAVKEGVILINKAREINRERESRRGKFVTMYKDDQSMEL